MRVTFEPLIDRMGQNIQLRSTKLGGAPHFAWTCRVVDVSPSQITLYQAAGTPIQTWKEVWTPDFDARIYFWAGRWFNVIETLNPSGDRGGYYCNIITPARWIDGELRWDDLDLDISVQPDGTYRILDEDEWARNAERLRYAPEVVAHARCAVDELIASIERRAFPFIAGS